MSTAQTYRPAHGGFPTHSHIGRINPSSRSVAQQRAVAGGIQPHSIGGLYPLSVVCIDNGDQGRHYEIHDLQKGEAAILSYSRYNQPTRKWVGNAGGYDLAHAFAEDVQAGRKLTDWA